MSYFANVLASKKKLAHRDHFLVLYLGPVIYIIFLGYYFSVKNGVNAFNLLFNILDQLD